MDDHAPRFTAGPLVGFALTAVDHNGRSEPSTTLTAPPVQLAAVTRDTSLDEFAGVAEEGDEEGDEAGGDAGHHDEVDDQPDEVAPADAGEPTPDDVDEAEPVELDPEKLDPEEPAPEEPGPEVADETAADTPDGPTPIYGFDPDGRCGVCEERAPTRYREGGGWVCADCKDW